MKYSLVIGFKNRDLDRVKRNVLSLANQHFKDFELIFVDYGSDPGLAQSIREFLEPFGFVRYIYSDTRRRAWNRSHALNIGVLRATGDYTITTDIDLIYPPDFLDIIDREIEPGHFYHAFAYYLPEHFSDYDSLFSGKTDISAFGPPSPTAFGMCQIVESDVYKKLQGFDEYYRIWGFEDLDMRFRLEQLGLTLRKIEPGVLQMYHQWHPGGDTFAIDKSPKSWFFEMSEYFEQRKKDKNPPATAIPRGRIWETKERTSLQFLQSEDRVDFNFIPPLSNTLARLYARFFALSSGDHLCIDATFEKSGGLPETRAGSLMGRLNQLLSKATTTYAIDAVQNQDRDRADFYSVRDNLFYFIVNMEPYFQDYIFEYTPEGRITFLVVKA